MDQSDYKQTGKSIPIKIPELTSFVHNKLDEYMYLTSSLQMQPKFNPFKQPIIYSTSEGKLVQVPDNIKKDAIASWQAQQKNKPAIENFDNSPSGTRDMFDFSNVGTPLEQTSHMAGTMTKNSDVQRMFDNDPNLKPIRKIQPRKVNSGAVHNKPYVNEYMSSQATPRPTEKIVVVEKDNSTLLYIIIFLILAAISYYIYITKKN